MGIHFEDLERVSRSVVSDSLQPRGCRLLCPWNSPGKNSGVGSHSLLQGIFPIQGSNACLLHWKQILYCLNHGGLNPPAHWESLLLGRPDIGASSKSAFLKNIYLFSIGCAGSSLWCQLFFRCHEQGLFFVEMLRLLVAVASLVVEHRLQAWGFRSCGSQALGHRLNSCGALT